MNKFLSVLLLNLLWWNIGFANENVILECRGDYFYKNKKTKSLDDFSYKTIIDFKNKTSQRDTSDFKDNIIITDTHIYSYSSGWTVGTGDNDKPFYFSVETINRINGDLKAESNIGSETAFNLMREEIYPINSSIKNYKSSKGLGGYENFEVSSLGNFDQEYEKFKIVQKFINNILDRENYSYVIYKCSKSDKEF